MLSNAAFDMLTGHDRWTCWGLKHHSHGSFVHLSFSALQQHARLFSPHGIGQSGRPISPVAPFYFLYGNRVYQEQVRLRRDP